MSDGQVRMGPGTLYGSILRMTDTDLIEEVTGPKENGDERRRNYRLTVFGRQVLSLELHRLNAVMNVARRKQLVGAPLPEGAA